MTSVRKGRQFVAPFTPSQSILPERSEAWDTRWITQGRCRRLALSHWQREETICREVAQLPAHAENVVHHAILIAVMQGTLCIARDRADPDAKPILPERFQRDVLRIAAGKGGHRPLPGGEFRLRVNLRLLRGAEIAIAGQLDLLARVR